MSGKQLWVAALAVVAVVSSRATAQNEKNQLTGIVGRTSISNEGIKGATFSNPFVRFGNGFSFEVNFLAFSRPRQMLARLGYPLSRSLQKRFAEGSKAAMMNAASGK